ncbi:MAG: glycine cleavage system aminomethyltransferase GcvT [Chitinophagales bacterium]|nr:glycine cleavage system aminomethyltransferase GcvT [Chitinophagales bacterium]
MKNTPITHVHVDSGAKMGNFAGFNMPISYSSVNEEHLNVRQHVSLFDVSHMGEIFLKGPDALANAQMLTSNDVSKLSPGKAQYSTMLNEHGGIIDDLLVYMLADDEFMFVVNGANLETDWQWILDHRTGDCQLHNRTENIGLIAVQGPKAIELVQHLVKSDVSDIKYYTFRKDNVAGIEDVIISATGYTGSGGFELYCKSADTESLWNNLILAGEEFNAFPAGLAARNTLRLEMGFCLHGNDITQETNPLEAGLGWIVKFNKDFIGKDALQKIKEKGLDRKLCGFEMMDRAIGRQGYPVCDADHNEIGVVTSGSFAPSLNKNIGLAYLPIELSKGEHEIFIKIRNKFAPAKTTSLPFYKV